MISLFAVPMDIPFNIAEFVPSNLSPGPVALSRLCPGLATVDVVVSCQVDILSTKMLTDIVSLTRKHALSLKINFIATVDAESLQPHQVTV